MKDSALTIERDGWRLDAVPAVHFCAAFAAEVNRLCYDAATRPTAVAVELGAETAAAAATWLRELCAGPGAERTFLPCMLGLARPNRRLRVSARDRAVELQRATGRQLHELPPRVLKELLGYSALSVLYLSPTDSIIEAIRCAVELGLPLYGVDLDESAEAQRAETLLKDPSRATGSVRQYVTENARYAEQQRDEEIDHRREVAMAARLKTVLERHQHVLFTGGLAHWSRLENFLTAPDPRPAPAPPAEATEPVGFSRVVVHPLLAIYHMDVFPAFANAYEDVRNSVKKPLRGTPRTVDVIAEFMSLLANAYEQHFRHDDAGEQIDRQLEDLEARTDFEQLMTNLCLLDQTGVPSLFTALIAAQGIMSPQFCECFATELMKFPWASPQDFSSLPVLAPAPTELRDELRGEVLEPDGAGHYKRRGEWIYVQSNPGRSSQRVRVKVPWVWPLPEPPPPPGGGGQPLSWPPTVYLMGAMSLRAMQVAQAQSDQARVEPFEGGLGDGIDIKATVRSHARGEDRFFIRKMRRAPKARSERDTGWDTIVWLLRPQEREHGEWEVMGFDLPTLLNNAPNRQQLESKAAEFGSKMIEAIGFGRRYRPGQMPADLGIPPGVRNSKSISSCFSFAGILLYLPPFFDAQKEAAWAAEMDHKRAPFYAPDFFDSHDVLPPSLRRMFRERHQLQLDERNWPIGLIRMAIPYAGRAVTAVVPDRFLLPGIVFEEATRRGIELRVVPHSYFPRDTLRKIGLLYWVPPESGSGRLEFDPSFSRIFAENPTAYRHLIPGRWLNYGAPGK